MSESLLRRALRNWWRSLTSSGWMWLWTASIGLVGVGAGAYYAYGAGSRSQAVWITVGFAAAGLAVALLGAFVLQFLYLAPRDQRNEARSAYAEVVARQQAMLDERESRRKGITATFQYDGHLYVYITNQGPSLPDARINLFVPKLDRLTAKRLDEQGRDVNTGATAEVAGHLAQGVEGAFRWSELHMYLPGANTTWGLRFDIGRVWQETDIRFGLNADELGDWLWWTPTIHPLEGDEWLADAPDDAPGEDED